MVWNYQNADCILRKKFYCVIYCNFPHTRFLFAPPAKRDKTVLSVSGMAVWISFKSVSESEQLHNNSHCFTAIIQVNLR